MALSDNALVSLEEVKRFYFPDMNKSKSQDDDLFEELIDRITDQFEMYCDIDSFHDNDYIEYLDSAGSCLFIKNIPLNSITNIWNDTDWVWGNDSTADSTDYRIVNDRYIIFKYHLTQGNQNIKISYNGGYSNIPGDLKQICIKEVVREFKHRQDFDIISKSLEDGSSTRVESGLMTSTTQILDKYKRIRAF